MAGCESSRLQVGEEEEEESNLKIASIINAAAVATFPLDHDTQRGKKIPLFNIFCLFFFTLLCIIHVGEKPRR